MKLLARALHDDRAFELELTLLGGERGLGREIEHDRIQKPGLALAGFVTSIGAGRLLVVGNTELSYLETLSPEAYAAALDALFSTAPACLVVTGGREIPTALLARANGDDVPLFRTALGTGSFIGRVHEFLDAALAPEVTVHGVLIDVYGVGVLLTGHSGIGKSECALDLVLRGHRLVADDVVLVRRRRHELIGRGPELTRHHMEVRGLGIINVKDLYGAASVREKKRVELIVEMVDWDSGIEYDRTGIEEASEVILSCEVGKVTLPIRQGRNLASIVEVAARNHLLKMQGHHPALAFQRQLEERLAAMQRDDESREPT